MPDPVADLVRDAASLHQFISSICGRRDELERTHRESTVEFLQYIRNLGENAQRFLQAFIERVPQSPNYPDLTRFERQGLTTIRNFWINLHALIRPAEDAHTLSIPVALIAFLERALSDIPGLEASRLVISHTPELNYFQYPRTNLRYHAQTYEAIVPGSPAFPKKLALIGMPYSQASSLFLNLVICHELGHFAFEELGLEERLSREIDRILKTTLSEYDSVSEPDLSWCRERLKYWSEEVYCDRFAIGLVGPAYCFAYIELFDIVGISATDDVFEFSDTHPSDACRFKEHAQQLKDGGWWDLLDEIAQTTYIEVVKRLAALPDTDYVYESAEKSSLAAPVLAAFLQLKPKVAGLVTESFGDQLRRFRRDLDRKEIDLVKTYLSYGVVPSTLVREGTEQFPDAVALLNAAYLFYLERLPDLMRRIANQNPKNLSHRSRWAQRVEMWTLKALEDLMLLSHHEETTDGSAIAESNL